MSMTTSRLKVWRNSSASSETKRTAIGSSPFTWNIGASIIFATSVQYCVERASAGSVVKPIWLFTMRWIVPPMR